MRLRTLILCGALAAAAWRTSSAQATPGPSVACGPDSVVNTLKVLMSAMDFTSDSSNLDHLPGDSTSSLRVKAEVITDPLVCRQASALYREAMADPPPDDWQHVGSAVARVGSFYFIYENWTPLYVAVADKRWAILTVMGFSGD